MGSSESTERSMQEGNSSTETPIEANKKDQIVKVAVAVAAAGVLVAWGISSLLSGAEPEKDKKTMKAPGRDGAVIYRDDFEGDPASYFKSLRNKDK